LYNDSTGTASAENEDKMKR